MKKSELLQWLNDQSWCASVGEPVVVDASIGWQKVVIREVDGDVAINRSIHFYETTDGCYWKDSEPVKTLGNVENTTPMYKMITFRTILNAMGAEAYTTMRMRISAAAEQSLVLSDVVKMLETYGPDGGIDINSTSTQAIIQSLVGTGVLTQAEADTVVALAD